jgi:hypothetical protein
VTEVVTQEVVREVPVEKIVEVEKETVKTIEVEKPVEVIKEVVKEVRVPGETVVVEKEGGEGGAGTRRDGRGREGGGA